MWEFIWVVDSHGKMLTIRYDGKVVHQFNDDGGQWNRIGENGEHQPVEQWVTAMLDMNYGLCGGFSDLMDSTTDGE